jgi:hypothetical protein
MSYGAPLAGLPQPVSGPKYPCATLSTLLKARPFRVMSNSCGLDLGSETRSFEVGAPA